MNKLEEINIRILNADEFSRRDLLEIFHKHNSIVPNALSANIQVAEDKSGKIIAIAVLQPQYHAEPIYVDKEYRDTVLHEKLIEELLEPLKRMKNLCVYVFAPKNKIANLAERFGFKQLDYKVFMRKF